MNSIRYASLTVAAAVLVPLSLLVGCSSSTTNTLPGIGCSDCPPPAGGDSGTTPPPGTDSGTTPPGTDSGTPPPMDASTTTMNETWKSGKMLSGPVIIAAGVTVTIDPGAMIMAGSGVTITVNGTLTAATSTTHGAISGTGWGGIIVAKGGSLTLDSVDLTNAATAIDTQSGNAAATYNNGIIGASGMPFKIETGSTFSTAHSQVTGTKGSSSVGGSFTASHLDYDANGNAGIETIDVSATISIEDSTLHGPGPVSDFLVTSGAANVHVAYTEIKGVHCGFHFNSISKFDISYTTDHQNAWGAMLYGSDLNGKGSITFSNFDTNSSFDLEEAGQNGPITVDSCYMNGMSTLNIPATNPQAAPVPNAMPRP